MHRKNISGNLLLVSDNQNYKIIDTVREINVCNNTDKFSPFNQKTSRLPQDLKYYRGYDGLFLGAYCHDGQAGFFVPSQNSIRGCFGLKSVYRNEDLENVQDAWSRLSGPSIGNIFRGFDSAENKYLYNQQIHYFYLASRQFIRASRYTEEKIFYLGGYDYNKGIEIQNESLGLPPLEEISYAEALKFLANGFKDTGEFVFVEYPNGSLKRKESAEYQWRNRNYRTGNPLKYYHRIELKYKSPGFDNIVKNLGSITRLSTLTCSQKPKLRPPKSVPKEIDLTEGDRFANFILCTPLHLQRYVYNFLIMKGYRINRLVGN